MATLTRVWRALRLALAGGRTAVLSPYVRDAERALERADNATRALERELGIGHASLTAATSRLERKGVAA